MQRNGWAKKGDYSSGVKLKNFEKMNLTERRLIPGYELMRHSAGGRSI